MQKIIYTTILMLFLLKTFAQEPSYVHKHLVADMAFDNIGHLAKIGDKLYGIGCFNQELLDQNEICKIILRGLEPEDGTIVDTVIIESQNGKTKFPSNISLHQNKLFVLGEEKIQLSESKDIFLMVFNEEREVLWEQSYGLDGRWERGLDITFDSENNIIIGGLRSLLVAPNRLGTVLIKTSPSGEMIWEREVVGSISEFKTRSVVVDGEDNIYALGDDDSFVPSLRRIGISKFSAEGDSLWTKYYDFGSFGGEIKLTGDNNLLISSRVSEQGASLTKLTLEGELIWSKGYDEYLTSNINKFKKISTGNYAILDRSGILLVDGKKGEYILSRNYFEDYGLIETNDLVELDDGSFLITGSYWTVPNSSPQRGIWLLRTDALFNPVSVIYSDSKALDINVYPNPSYDIIYLDNNTDYEIDMINLIDIQGKIITSFKNKTEINISTYPNGTYYLNFLTGEKIIGSKKIVKM